MSWIVETIKNIGPILGGIGSLLLWLFGWRSKRKRLQAEATQEETEAISKRWKSNRMMIHEFTEEMADMATKLADLHKRELTHLQQIEELTQRNEELEANHKKLEHEINQQKEQLATLEGYLRTILEECDCPDNEKVQKIRKAR